MGWLSVASNKNKINKKELELFKKAVPSQKRSDIYDNLLVSGQLDRFLVVLRLCGQRKYKEAESVGLLKQYFPVECKSLNVKEFKQLLGMYADVRGAWTFDKEIDVMMSYANASKIAQTTTNIDDVIKFHEHFDDTDTGLFVGKNKDDGGDDNVTQVNIFNSRLDD